MLLFLGNGILAFSGLSCLLGVLYLPDELLQFFQQVLIGDAEHLHLVRVDLHRFWRTSGRSAVHVAWLVLHPWRIDVAPACVPS